MHQRSGFTLLEHAVRFAALPLWTIAVLQPLCAQKLLSLHFYWLRLSDTGLLKDVESSSFYPPFLSSLFVFHEPSIAFSNPTF